MSSLCIAIFAWRALAGAAQSAVATELWLLAPTGKDSTLSSRTTAIELQRRFGRERLRFADIPVPEDVLKGAILFPDDPVKRVELVWSDPDTRENLAFAQVRGRQSDWKVAPGIRLGTPLSELHRVNGRAFAFYGFGFDGGGLINDWRNGRMAALERGPTRITIRLLTGDGAPHVESTRGDRELLSDMPAVAKLDAYVWWITVRFEGELANQRLEPAAVTWSRITDG